MRKLLAFGITLIAGGFYWRFCQDAFSYFDEYVVAGDPFLAFMKLCWYALPWVVMGIGVALLLASAKSNAQGG
jgi:hypothetical protein